MKTAKNVRCAPLVAALFLTIGMASGAKAQEAAVDFAQLETKTRPGDTVSVIEAGGRETKWKLGTVPLQTLIQRAGLSIPEVRVVTVARDDSLWNGALIGLAVAGVPWLVVCAANDWCCYNEYGA